MLLGRLANKAQCTEAHPSRNTEALGQAVDQQWRRAPFPSPHRARSARFDGASVARSPPPRSAPPAAAPPRAPVPL
jgi:hypothetical protein